MNVFGLPALDWLLDINLPLIVEDASWRGKAETVRLLPMWFYEPEPKVRAFFMYLRNAGPKPALIDDDLWQDVRAHLEGDPDNAIDHPGDFIAWLWFFTFYKNRDGKRRKELATPTVPQLTWAWRFMANVDAGVPVRMDLLKYRQGGFSWEVCQAVNWIICTRKNIGALCVAHEKTAAQRVFSYLKDGHEWLPDEIRPAKEHSSKNDLFLRNPKEAERQQGNVGQDSIAIVQTAGTDFVGTSVPLQVALVDEIGKWHVVCDPEQTYTSMINTIQDEPGTFVFRVSTAFGADTFWHKECLSSRLMGKPGWNGFTMCFFPWYYDERNTLKAPPTLEDELGAREDDEFGDEVKLRVRFGLSLDQLWWRRHKIRSQAETRSKIELFNQEHPSTFEMAWLYAFGRWIEGPLILLLHQRLKVEREGGLLRPIFIGDLNPLRERGIEMQMLTPAQEGNDYLHRRAMGPLTIFRAPDWRYDYVSGTDVSEGDGADHSCVKVYQRLPSERDGDHHMRIAAEWYGLIDVDVLADVMWRLGHFYSTGRGRHRFPALLAWERTGPGHGLSKWLRLGARGRDTSDAYPAARMYRRHEPDDRFFSQDSAYGINTNRATKPVLMSELKRAARDGNLQLTSEDIDEIQSISRNERGFLETGGRDRTMAAAMAVYATLFSMPAHGEDDKREDVPPIHSVRWARDAGKRSEAPDHDDTYEEEVR